MFYKLKKWAKRLKENILILFLVYKDKRVPLLAKLISMVVVAYALSPIDLIPDFIPVLGLLDDIILLPIGITLAIKLIPVEVFKEYTAKAEHLSQQEKPRFRTAGVIVILIWILIAAYVIYIFSY